MSVVTEVQTVVHRLTPRPDQHMARTPLITWPFLPKAQEPMAQQLETLSKPVSRPPPALLRTSSLVKLRQFCNQSCDALLFLRARRSALQSALNHGLAQAKALILIMAVYLTLVLLAVQLATCLYLLTGKPAPPGLIFMVVSLFAIMGTFSKIIVSFTNRTSTSRPTRRTMHSHKKNQ